MNTQIYRTLEKYIDDISNGINIWFEKSNIEYDYHININLNYVNHMKKWLEDYEKSNDERKHNEFKLMELSNGEYIVFPLSEYTYGEEIKGIDHVGNVVKLGERERDNYVRQANLILHYSDLKMSNFEKANYLYNWYLKQIQNIKDEFEKKKIDSEQYKNKLHFFDIKLILYLDYIEKIIQLELKELEQLPVSDKVSEDESGNLPSHIGGNNKYKKKYFKYKNKYLHLTKKL